MHHIIHSVYIANSLSTDLPYFDLIIICTKDEMPFSFKSDSKSITIRIPVKEDQNDSSLLLHYMSNTDILEKIHSFITNNKAVLVYCSPDMNRSCAVLSCYLIRYHKMTAVEAVQFIRSKLFIKPRLLI
jgi:hypothetical protein